MEPSLKSYKTFQLFCTTVGVPVNQSALPFFFFAIKMRLTSYEVLLQYAGFFFFAHTREVRCVNWCSGLLFGPEICDETEYGVTNALNIDMCVVYLRYNCTTSIS